MKHELVLGHQIYYQDAHIEPNLTYGEKLTELVATMQLCCCATANTARPRYLFLL
jgi:hypothetical protein